MDVDSTMSTDSDHNPLLSNHDDHPLSPEPSTSPPGTPPLQVQPQATGPRPAPIYYVVNSVIEKEDGPGSRCGHMLTVVAAVGEEGRDGYIGPRLILFGGATGSSATADVHHYDVLSNKWSKLTPLGEPPSPRAAHVATAVAPWW